MRQLVGFAFVDLILCGCSASGDIPYVGPSDAGAPAPGSIELGVAGDGGLLDAASLDVVTPLLGSGGELGHILGGGEAGTLGGLLPALPLPPLPVAGMLSPAALPLPSLGVSGQGGLGEDLLGYDIVGGLIGTGEGLLPALLAGGDKAPLGHAVPDGTTPLLPVGEPLETIVAALGTSSRDNNLSGLSPLLTPLLFELAGTSDGGGLSLPLPDLSTATASLSPVLTPVLDGATAVAGTQLPNGTTLGDLLNIGLTAVGVANDLLPLEAVTTPLADTLP